MPHEVAALVRDVLLSIVLATAIIVGALFVSNYGDSDEAPATNPTSDSGLPSYCDAGNEGDARYWSAACHR